MAFFYTKHTKHKIGTKILFLCQIDIVDIDELVHPKNKRSRCLRFHIFFITYKYISLMNVSFRYKSRFNVNNIGYMELIKKKVCKLCAALNKFLLANEARKI